MIRALLLALACALTLPASAAERKTIAVVSAHLGDFAQRLGGDAVEVLFEVEPGRDPALWRPSIAQIGAIQDADLIVLSGADYARWASKTSLPRARLVRLDRGLEDRFIVTQGAVTHAHGGEEEHSHDGIAPQIWLDFALAQAQATALSDAMAQRLGLDVGTAREALLADLAALETRAVQVLAGGHVTATLGPGFEYLTAAYAPEARMVETVAEGVLTLIPLDMTPPTPQAIPFDFGATPAEGGFVARMQANLDRIAAALPPG